jgi:putative ABC transport system permease protein
MRRWWGGLRVATRIARRDARRARGRTALVTTLIGLPILAGSTGGVFLASGNPSDATYTRWILGDEAQAFVGAYFGGPLDQDLLGTSAGGSTAPGNAWGLAEYEEALGDALPAGAQLLRVVRSSARLTTPDRAVPPTTDVLGLPADGDLSSVVPVQEGVLPGAPDEVALNDVTAERLGVTVGDSIGVEPTGGEARDVVVTGILAPSAQGPRVVAGPGLLATPEELSGPQSLAVDATRVEWYVLGPEPVTWEHVLAVNALGSTVTSRTVVADPPPRSAMPYWDGGGGSVESGALWLAAAIAGMVLLEAALLIGPAFAVGARRSQRQLALLAAAGADRRTLRQVVLLTGMVTGLAASAVATFAGLFIALVIRAVVRARSGPFVMPDLRVPWLVLLGFAVVGTLAATLAAWLPARRAARVDVVAALAGRRAEAQPRRRVAVTGVVLAAVGLAAAVIGAGTGRPAMLVVGVLVLEIGVVAASGALVALAARLAPRLGPMGRIALRDAARNRSRTAPAVAAVIAAVAGIAAGAMYLQADHEYQVRQWAPAAKVGTVTVQFLVSGTGELAAAEVEDAAAALRRDLPVTDVAVVTLAVPPPDESAQSAVSFGVVRPAGQQCPLWNLESPTPAEQRDAGRDPRCQSGLFSREILWMSNVTGSTTLVDDGTVVTALGLPWSAEAARALSAGRVVVESERDIWPDGTAHLELRRWDDATQSGTIVADAQIPAVAADVGMNSSILPPAALEALGMDTEVAGLVAPVSRPPTPVEEAAAASSLGPEALLRIVRDPVGDPNPVMLVLVAAALVVGLAATAITVVLAGVESRPDLATLAAIGADPRARRRFAAAQAGVVATLGGTLGVGTGLMLGRVLVTAQRYRDVIPDYRWVPVVPWPTVAAIAVGMPALAMGLGYLATRSRLPLVRRMAT